MSGPVTDRDVTARPDHGEPAATTIEVLPSRESQVGAFRVRRALPRRARRTVGAWCFADHMGPAQVSEARGLDVAPHPHIGLQTVTWLFDGEALHRDSLGTEQVIAPGQLNLMSAGNGVSHSEESTGAYHGVLEGMQLWVAQPTATRHGAPAFEHHAELPRVDLTAAVATVLVGELAGAVSPARRDTDHVGVDLELRSGSTAVPLRPGHEHALVVCRGVVTVEGQRIAAGELALLGTGRDELVLRTDGAARALLLGGTPFEEDVLMWWNFVARTRDEITVAHADWSVGSERYGRVASPLARTEVGPPPWVRE